MQVHFAAVVAIERGCEIARKRQAAPLAKWRTDKLHLPLAIRAHKPFLRRGRFILAKCADFGVKQAKRSVDRALGEDLSIHNHVDALDNPHNLLNLRRLI
jgi:hypothetical protein